MFDVGAAGGAASGVHNIWDTVTAMGHVVVSAAIADRAEFAPVHGCVNRGCVLFEVSLFRRHVLIHIDVLQPRREGL